MFRGRFLRLRKVGQTQSFLVVQPTSEGAGRAAENQGRILAEWLWFVFAIYIKRARNLPSIHLKRHGGMGTIHLTLNH
jgi:hypothetical protein